MCLFCHWSLITGYALGVVVGVPFKKGHRIRLDITSSSFPRWDRNPNTGHDFGEDQKSDFVVAQQTPT